MTKLEQAVITAAVVRRTLQTEGHDRVSKHLPTDYDLGLRYFNAVQAEEAAIDELIAERERLAAIQSAFNSTEPQELPCLPMIGTPVMDGK